MPNVSLINSASLAAALARLQRSADILTGAGSELADLNSTFSQSVTDFQNTITEEITSHTSRGTMDVHGVVMMEVDEAGGQINYRDSLFAVVGNTVLKVRPATNMVRFPGAFGLEGALHETVLNGFLYIPALRIS